MPTIEVVDHSHVVADQGLVLILQLNRHMIVGAGRIFDQVVVLVF